MPGTTELIIIFVILIFIFGLGKLPKAAKQLGQSVKSFQDGVQGKEEEIEVGGNDADADEPSRIENQQVSQAAREASMAGQPERTET